MMHSTGQSIEREARARLPGILADLLDEDDLRFDAIEDAGGVDLRATDSADRLWLIEVKASASPGHVARAAEQLAHYVHDDDDAIPLLVVPYMTRGAVQVAEDLGVNWVDLAGNAHIREENLYVYVAGRANPFRSPGRPSSPFAPKSARVTRVMLLDPARWWRQRDLVEETGLHDGNVSRVVRRLEDLALVVRRDREYRPSDPRLLLTAWADEYRLDRHDLVFAHMSGSGVDVSRQLEQRLRAAKLQHAFTGLPAAWAMDHFARFRLASVYVVGDPRDALERLDLRRAEKGANVQLIGPDDHGVFKGAAEHDGLTCVAPLQAYLDLRHLPERAEEAADHLLAHRLRWDDGAS
ncbi:MAG TPA: hypothetical protein VGW75_16065 [Solirubrobacteraceae bacterium]|jgi:DNA-binding MarR family transcriptional regulator|nr:hypothetical protein [Solirubrobacteraceae bacterium]